MYKLLRSHHPALVVREPRAADIDRVLKSMAAIIDALNPVRNLASSAHPNDAVLHESEAMLVIISLTAALPKAWKNLGKAVLMARLTRTSGSSVHCTKKPRSYALENVSARLREI
ncbi:MAG: abortive infection family protein [Acidobacteria bacterium]|nr:abortive infection family protein [Acidobacteriota bacterium]